MRKVSGASELCRSCNSNEQLLASVVRILLSIKEYQPPLKLVRLAVCLLLLSSQMGHAQVARFNLTNINVNQAAAVLRDFTGQAVILASEVTGSITLSSSKPLDRRDTVLLFATALRAQGLALHSVAGELIVTRASSPPPLMVRERGSTIETRIFTLEYLTVAEVSPGVRTSLSREGEISAKNNNTLIVSDKYSALLEITRYVLAADKPKELSFAQKECGRVLDAASVLQRHFVADELSSRQLRILIQTLENGSDCAGNAQLAVRDVDRQFVANVNRAPVPIGQVGASGGPMERVLASDVETSIKQLASIREKPSSEDAVTRALEVALQNWREAWSRGDVASYLGYYAVDFSPADQATLADWKTRRKAVLARAMELSVDIADVSIDFSDTAHATTVFTQTYRSKGFRDVVKKSLQWVYLNDRWVIAQERVLRRLPLKKN